MKKATERSANAGEITSRKWKSPPTEIYFDQLYRKEESLLL
jgi:hypothetical protein